MKTEYNWIEIFTYFLNNVCVCLFAFRQIIEAVNNRTFQSWFQKYEQTEGEGIKQGITALSLTLHLTTQFSCTYFGWKKSFNMHHV